MSQPSVTQITSTANPRIKELVRLRERRARDERGLLLIEGYRELTRALAAKVALLEFYYCPSFFLGENEAALIAQAAALGAALFELSPEPFRKISYRDRPDGLIATAPQVGMSLDRLPLKANPLLIIAEAIEKPGNLGTMLRSADAVGADGIVICDGVTDINNPNVVRASTGTLFHVPVACATRAETLAFVKERGLALLAATPHAEAVYTDIDLRGPLAFAVGAEQYGLSDELMAAADIKVRIPMAGIADSLNVSTATAILLFEIARQRSVTAKSI